MPGHLRPFLQLIAVFAIVKDVLSLRSKVTTDRFGYVYHNEHSDQMAFQTCFFTPPTEGNDMMFTIQFLSYTALQTKEFMVLPDGTFLRIPSRTIASNFTPWCGVYVRRGSSCQVNVTYTNLCQQPTTYSRFWPPRLIGYIATHHMLVTYAFIQCPNVEVRETSPIPELQTTFWATNSESTTPELATIRGTDSTAPSNEKMHGMYHELSTIVLATLLGITSITLVLVVLRNWFTNVNQRTLPAAPMTTSKGMGNPPIREGNDAYSMAEANVTEASVTSFDADSFAETIDDAENSVEQAQRIDQVDQEPVYAVINK